MSREGEPMFKGDRIILSLGIALAVIGTPFVIRSLIEENEARNECIFSDQINAKGQKLEGFVDGKGCERFLVSRNPIYLHSPMGGW